MSLVTALAILIFSASFLANPVIGQQQSAQQPSQLTPSNQMYPARRSGSRIQDFNQFATQQPSATRPATRVQRQPAKTLTTYHSETKQLLRATYLLPSSAAKSLTELFQHKATSLVECRTEESEDDTTAALVKLVITAEPHTQKAIRDFLTAVFPDRNIKGFVTSERNKLSVVKKPKRHQVTVKLPKMTCGGCAASVKSYLTSVEKVDSIKVNLKKRLVTFSTTAAAEIEQILNRAQEENQFFETAEIQTESVKASSALLQD